MAFSAILQRSFKVASRQAAALALESSYDSFVPAGTPGTLDSIVILDQGTAPGNLRGEPMHPLPSTETEKEHIGNRSGRVFLAALMLLACFYPSSTRAQEAEKDRQKAHRTAPPDWDAGLIGLVLPARRAKPAATLLNAGDSISPGAAFTNPVRAGTLNNRAGSLSLGTGSTSAPSQFSGHPSRPPITSDTWLGGLGNWSNPANWSMGVPANDGTTDVFIDNGNSKVSPVTLDVHAAIHHITIDMDDSLSITNGNSLAVDGPRLTNTGP